MTNARTQVANDSPARPGAQAAQEGLQAFHWERQPVAEALVRGLIDDFLAHHAFGTNLARRMKDETGTRFYDWVSNIIALTTTEREQQVLAAGFLPTASQSSMFWNPNGVFPTIQLHPQGRSELYLKVDSVADFLAAHQLEVPILGFPFAPVRRAEAAPGLFVIERRGLDEPNAAACLAAQQHLERFRCRQRHFAAAHEGFAHAHDLVDRAIADLGADWTCSLFFHAEREYWQRRNRAAQVQKARQDRLGLGWGNHDHHTYRSSRAHFKDLIAFHEKLGLVCRERFYAGREAGWGAQVMENPRAGIITFNDVDLSPEELADDFAHQPLAERSVLGTIGLWCGLHGEAFLQAGMHHLECQFDFDALKQQLEREHAIGVMKPFTDFPHLRQAFTEGERWPVAPERIERLLAAGRITPAQAEQFRTQGAIGSHLENLERNEGYKGFNQKGVSEIIAATDPRRHLAADDHKS